MVTHLLDRRGGLARDPLLRNIHTVLCVGHDLGHRRRNIQGCRIHWSNRTCKTLERRGVAPTPDWLRWSWRTTSMPLAG
ncbi:hypothetical protein, partial [Burkholderia contaminans]|uniref:hypothetical protein n=1 Tax=Burkholderia contaminans TaxID=488447 RepID=UPI001C613DDE